MENKQKRHYDNDPTPEEALAYMAEASDELREEAYGKPGRDMKDVHWAEKQVTLHDLQCRVADKMRAKGDAFSSDYRHEVSAEHSLVYRILGSTVGVNFLIADGRKVRA